tara:strand:+ start:150 stop:833 length:684 start_codon:yes stop_codon:yes gene_type:complete
MARNLYSAYRSAGTSSGQYKASLYDVESQKDKMAFADKRGSWEQEKLSRNVETIGAGLELASTIAGGLQDKQEFKGELKAVGKEYGDLQPDARSFGQKLFGAEREYTFGKGKDSKTFSKAGVGVKGGQLRGESMLDESGFGVVKDEAKSESTGVSNISEYIEKPETLDVSADSDKSLWQTASGGLTAEANTKLYGEDPSMEGKSKKIRTDRYKELFENNFGTNPLGD